MSDVLLHYSLTPLTQVYSVPDQTNAQRSALFKPRGLWVSVEGEDDWSSWCGSQGFALERMKVVNEVILAKDANILWIRNVESFDNFHARFRSPLYPGSEMDGIRWDEVATLYQGIIIAPYLWQRRMDPMWYYGWDCASGCIWDAKAIAKVRVRAYCTCDPQPREWFMTNPLICMTCRLPKKPTKPQEQP